MNSQSQHSSLPRPSAGVRSLLLLLLTTPLLARIAPLEANRAVLREAAYQPAAQVIPNCKIYNSQSVCTACLRDYYLQGGVCVALAAANRISHCNIYASATACASCDAGYYVNAAGNGCVLGPTNLNCQTFLSQNQCATCKAGSVLNASGACVPIANCAAISGSVCSYCQSGYYLNSGVCTAVPNFVAVAHCSQYLSDSRCSQCEAGYILSSDGKSCVLVTSTQFWDTWDPNCVDLRYNDPVVCSICRQGFKLDAAGVCQPIDGLETCMIYDPDTTTGNATCRVCMSGYTMLTPRGACVLNGNVTLAGQTDPLSAFRLGLVANVFLFASILVQLK